MVVELPGEPYAQLPLAVLFDERLSHGGARCYALLQYHWRTSGQCFAKQETLAAELKVAVRSMRDYLRELRRLGYIKQTRRPNQSALIVPLPLNAERQNPAYPKLDVQNFAAPDRQRSAVPERQVAAAIEVEALEEETNEREPEYEEGGDAEVAQSALVRPRATRRVAAGRGDSGRPARPVVERDPEPGGVVRRRQLVPHAVAPQPPPLTPDAQAVVAYWRERTGKPRFQPNPAQRERLEAQLLIYGLTYMLERAKFMSETDAGFIQMLRAADSWAKPRPVLTNGYRNGHRKNGQVGTQAGSGGADDPFIRQAIALGQEV